MKGMMAKIAAAKAGKRPAPAKGAPMGREGGFGGKGFAAAAAKGRPKVPTGRGMK